MVNSAFERVIPESHEVRVEIEQEEDETQKWTCLACHLQRVALQVPDLVLASTCQTTWQVAVW